MRSEQELSSQRVPKVSDYGSSIIRVRKKKMNLNLNKLLEKPGADASNSEQEGAH